MNGAGSNETVLTTMTTKGFIFLCFCTFNLAHARPQYHEYYQSFWDNARPGELLRSIKQGTTRKNLKTLIKESIKEHLRIAMQILHIQVG